MSRDQKPGRSTTFVAPAARDAAGAAAATARDAAAKPAGAGTAVVPAPANRSAPPVLLLAALFLAASTVAGVAVALVPVLR